MFLLAYRGTTRCPGTLSPAGPSAGVAAGARAPALPRAGPPPPRDQYHQRPMQAVGEVYAIPQEHLDFCATIGEIAREKIAPRSAEIDERAEYPWDIRKLLAEQDILGLPFGTEYGGTGTGTLMLNMA